MRTGKLIPLTLALVLLASGCGWIKATPGDHAAYRKTRVLPTFEERIGAAYQYLEERPDGAYADDVRRYYKRAEPVFFHTRQTTEKGMRSYLALLPKGPHAAEIKSRLRVLEEQRGRDTLVEAATLTRDRLERAAKSRAEAQAGLSRWLGILLDRNVFTSPLSDGPKELVIAYSLELPEPSCSSAEGAGAPERAVRICAKDATYPFIIPGPQRLEDRELSFLIEIALDEGGKPLRAAIAGEEMFSRLDETFAKTERRSESVRDRIEAVGRGVDFVSTSFERRVSPDASCAKPVTAPEVLRLECAGLRVVARAATEAGGTDEVVIEPL
ncbi:MAG: hypothetical protein HOV80_01695 [Polyangiaceae bacterium]|nr:hypothetical protein [Polyangiaceae bacterium]